jgi:hypothetical protein
MLRTFTVTLNEWVNFLAVDYGAVVIGLGAVGYLIAHVRKFREDRAVYFPWVMILGTLGIFVLLSFGPQPMSLGRMISLVLMYGVAVFVLLSRKIRGGWGARLTRWRGEKWIKELDYIYLTLGSAGILASINRLGFVTGRLEVGDLFAPLLLTTAVVLRFVKTRAEIGGWNKTDYAK